MTARFKAFLALLALLAIGYSYLGMSRLVRDVPGSYPIDLHLRWTEHRFLWQGLNPQLEGHPDVPASHEQMRTQGGSYPPWSYAIGTLFVPPIAFEWVRVYYAILCAIALGVLARWAAREAGVAGALSVLAIFAFAICISYGQYGILCAALVAASLELVSKGRPWLAGVCLGLALLKPQLTALFALTLLLYRYYSTIVVAGLIVVGASIVASLAAHSSLIPMVTRAAGEAQLYYWLSNNPLIPFLVPYLGFQRTATALALAGTAVLVVSWYVQGAGRRLSHTIAIAAVITMFWSNRKTYDTVIMALAMAPALGLGLERRGVYLLWALAMGVSLWLPLRGTQWLWTTVELGDFVLWSGGAAMFLFAARHRPLMAGAKRRPDAS